jgi:hypothetical protein
VEPIFGMIADIGFPIAISVYLLVRIEKKMESLTVSIQSLANAISEIK